MDTNIRKKNYSHSIVNKVYLKRNEELNLYDTCIEKTVYYTIKEYQKAYDANGKEIGELKVNEYPHNEEVTDSYNYLDYKNKGNYPPFGCQTLHFNNELNLVVMHPLITIDELGKASEILNRSNIFEPYFDVEYSFMQEDRCEYKKLGEHKGKIKRVVPWVDELIASYLKIFQWGGSNPFYGVDGNPADGEEYKMKTHVQIVATGNTRLIYYITSQPFDEKKYYNSLKEVEKITLDIWGEEKGDVHWCNYLHDTNKGLARIKEDYKLIYCFAMEYNFRGDNKIRIQGVLDDTIINKEYEIDSPNVIREIRKYFNELKKDGVYITDHQNKTINKIMEEVADNILSYDIDELYNEEEEEIEELPSRYKETQTYLMKNKRNGLYKIGKSTMPAYRERTLQSEEPEIEMVKLWKDNIEDILHKKYHKHRVRGEWFKLNKTQVKYICTHY